MGVGTERVIAGTSQEVAPQRAAGGQHGRGYRTDRGRNQAQGREDRPWGGAESWPLPGQGAGVRVAAGLSHQPSRQLRPRHGPLRGALRQSPDVGRCDLRWLSAWPREGRLALSPHSDVTGSADSVSTGRTFRTFNEPERPP